MLFITNLLLLAVSIFVLARSSIYLVKSLVVISGMLHLTGFSVAFLLMALATSLPEIFIAISAGLEGAQSLVLGNVLGSNIVDLTLVFGIVILISNGIKTTSVIARRDAVYMFVFTLAPIFLVSDRILSRGDALVLLTFYALYVIRLLDQRSAFHETPDFEKHGSLSSNLFWFIVGSVLLLASSYSLVFASKEIAGELGLSVGLVGLIIVALGTSLPELAFEIRAVRNNEDSMVLGDLIGSVVTNSTLVLAITALVRPIIIQNVWLYLVPVFFLGLVLVLFEFIVRQDRKLGVIDGLVLVLTYIFFLLVQFAASSMLGQ